METLHRSTAKANLRDILTAYGHSGAVALLAEVVAEALPARRGRPTRQEALSRLVVNGLKVVFNTSRNAEVDISREEKVA